MRELKFRGWDWKRNRYVGDGEIVFKSYGSEAAVVVCPNSQDYIGDICHDEYTDDGRFVIEQYTGLKDKNGKEIYDGDIVKWNDCIMKVVWENDCACFELVYPDNSIEDGMFVNEYMKNWIVIGNIHENPELIGGE